MKSRVLSIASLLAFSSGCSAIFEPVPEHDEGGGSEEQESVAQRQDELAGNVYFDSEPLTAQQSATVAILGPGGLCTGTLVSPTQVLTAGHCVCGGPGLNFYGMNVHLVQSNQNSKGADVHRIEVINAIPHPKWIASNCESNENGRPFDVALLTLKEPVHPSEVAPVEVYYGDKNNLDSINTVGFGSSSLSNTFLCGMNGNGGCPSSDGLRRSGLTYLDTIDDPCDKWLFEYGCWNDRIYLTYADLSSSKSLSGDSGAGIFGFLPGTTKPLLIATHSGRSSSDQQYDDPYMLRVRLANPSIRSWLTSHVPDTDADQDGVIDAIDNCKNQWNPNQMDDDLDGIGDACDNCSPYSKSCPTGIGCANPAQNDADQDGIGDACDPFPQCKANTPLLCAGCFDPAESCKLLGEACPQPLGTRACTTQTDCPFVNDPTKTQQCLVDPVLGGTGRCAYPGDSDGDGIADFCDLCPNFNNKASPAGAEQYNSNLEAELATGQASLPDACDPVPLGIGKRTGPYPVLDVFAGHLPVNQQEVGIVDAVRSRETFSTKSFLGLLNDTDSPTTRNGSLTFRGCQCDPEVGLDKCVSPKGQCRTFEPTLTLDFWKIISVLNATGGAAPVSINETFNNKALGAERSWTWRWKDDVAKLVFDKNKFISSDDSGLLFPYMPSGIAIQADIPGWSTGRPREDENNLRHTYLRLNAGHVDLRVRNIPLPLILDAKPCVSGNGCVLWLGWRKDIYINPGQIAEQPLRISFPHDGLMYQADNSGTYRLPKLDWLASALQNPMGAGIQAVGVAESTRQRVGGGDYSQFALLPASFSRNVHPLVIRQTERGFAIDGLREEFEMSPTLLQSLLEGSSSSEPEQAAQEAHYRDYEALLSTSMGKVFVAGGMDGRRHNNNIWAYDFEKKTWSTVLPEVSHLPMGKVRAMALDPVRHWLYALFNNDGPWVELVRYDLDAKTSKRLALWPDLKRSDKVYLNTLEDGTLVMSTTKAQSHIAYAFDVKPTGFTPVGVIVGLNGIAYPPQLGSEGLVWPLLDKQKRLTLRAVQRSSFKPGLPCDAL